MLTCCRKKKNCTLSHLKTQCLSSLLNPLALSVVALNAAHHVRQLGVEAPWQVELCPGTAGVLLATSPDTFLSTCCDLCTSLIKSRVKLPL